MQPIPTFRAAGRSRLGRSLRPLLAGLAAVALFALPGGGNAPVRAAERALPSVTVSDTLRRELDERGRTRAVVTMNSQADLAVLDRLGIRGTKLRVLPMMLVKGLTPGQLFVLERTAQVRSVYPNTRYKLQMEDTNWIIGSRYVWGPPHAPAFMGAGFEGEGVDIAVIDTGIDGGHEDTDNLVEFCDTTGAVTGARTEVACSPQGAGNLPLLPVNPGVTGARASAFDDEGHGSHVSGTIAGSGDASGGTADTHSTIGVAPKARLHVYSANVGPALANFQILAAYDDMTFKKLATPSSGVVATSNSFGGGDGANYSVDDPQNVAIKAAYDAGIVSVYAAGNSGPEHNTLSDSCINPYVVCVAATTKPDSVVQFSSRGRPSELADTNRNGRVGDDGSNDTVTTGDDIAADVAPDNHDRLLGQRLGIGVYRPTLAAPGVNINSISANSAGCREVGGTNTGCYEALNGTSMATPHVSGAIALIVQAWRSAHSGQTPSAATIIDILERSANVTKLPGYEAEEQGAGRLNVFDAVKYALGKIALPKPNFGTPSPVYASGKDPRTTFTNSRLPGNIVTGCTGALSFTARNSNPLDEGVDQPPDEEGARRAKQHLISVPAGAERLRITVRWPDHFGANIYARLWRPGVNPNNEFSAEFSERAFPDQEAIGLADTDAILNQTRFLDVRAPEAGTWRLRIYHRAGGDPGTCDPPGPEATGGYSYEVLTEIPVSARVPSVAISSPPAGSTFTSRFITFRGTATYPTRWDGVTNYGVPGTGIASGGPAEDPRLLLHFQGNVDEECTGNGFNDGPSGTNVCDGPFLLTKAVLDDRPAASYDVVNPIVTFNSERDGGVPNWIWDIDSETTLRGPMTVNWWGSCSACGPLLGSADWIIRIYADGKQQFEERVTETPSGPDETTLLSHDFDLPEIRASDRFVLHIDPVYIDSQNNAKIYYDSQDPCPNVPAGSPEAPCDSTVRLPVVDPNSATPSQVENLRVTDVHTGLRIAWDPANGSTQYEIHRSTNPAFVPGSASRIATTTGTGCTSPSVPSWVTASDAGALCYTDTATGTLTTYYYRVIGKNAAGQKADSSLLAYGTETQFDRQVKFKADRLYGPGYSDYAKLTSTDGTTWVYRLDTFERDTPSDSFAVSARSFTQGIGSANANRTVETIGDAPPEPRDPVVALTKTGPRTAVQGATITYLIRYENLGPEAASTARVTDVLPTTVTFVSATAGGTYNSTSRRVTWQLGTVSVGEIGTLTLKVRVRGTGVAPDGTVITNTANFTAPLTVATPGVWPTIVQ